MSLEDLRKQIDETDGEIVRLIARRLRLAEEIGHEKTVRHLPVTDQAREGVVLNNVRDIARSERISEAGIAELYQRIIHLAKSVEGLVVAYQGEPGAYSEEAAFRFFGPGIKVKPCESLDDVFQAVSEGEAQQGIVPIENSLEGSISRVYDLLLDSSLKVCGETELRVIHCLISSPDTSLAEVKKAYSHPQALGQSQRFLRHLGCQLISTYDTAGSVKMIKEMGIKDGAAVASARAAEIYSMKILARGIEDNPSNFTRFFILSEKESPPSGNDKTSIVFSVKHQPGALHSVLAELACRNINLTKIESRPNRKRPGNTTSTSTSKVITTTQSARKLSPPCRGTLSSSKCSVLIPGPVERIERQ